MNSTQFRMILALDSCKSNYSKVYIRSYF